MYGPLPPPTVTGSSIPTNMVVSNSQLDRYRELQERRRQAQAAIDAESKKYSYQSKHETPTGIKILGGIVGLGGLLYLGKKLFKK